jgi:hypothetical protein
MPAGQMCLTEFISLPAALNHLSIADRVCNAFTSNIKSPPPRLVQKWARAPSMMKVTTGVEGAIPIDPAKAGAIPDIICICKPFVPLYL